MTTPKLKQPTGAEHEGLARSCFDYIQFMDNDNEYHEDKAENYRNEIFEKAMEAFYSEDVWDWINNRRE